MARPKHIDDAELLALIKQYFADKCNNNPNRLKSSEITRYINSHGYPDYPATSLRRNPVAQQYISQLKDTIRNDDYITNVSYQTIDAAHLVDTHRSRDALIKAITDRDMYYKTISDAAAQSFERYNRLLDQLKSESSARQSLEDELVLTEEKLAAAEAECKTLAQKMKAYKSVVDKYVYPEIADELLSREGFGKKASSLINETAVEANLITSTTIIREETPEHRSGSKVIEGLFRLDD